MSFPRWTCRACKCEVDWIDAHYELEGDRLVAVFHRDCYAD